MNYYDTPWPVAYPWEQHVPVPGWGFTPNLAGPVRLGVGTDAAAPRTLGRYLIAPLVGAGVGYALGGDKHHWMGAALGLFGTLVVASQLEMKGA